MAQTRFVIGLEHMPGLRFITMTQQLGVVGMLSLDWEEPVKSFMTLLGLLSFNIEVRSLARRGLAGWRVTDRVSADHDEGAEAELREHPRAYRTIYIQGLYYPLQHRLVPQNCSEQNMKTCEGDSDSGLPHSEQKGHSTCYGPNMNYYVR
eukprot:595433-Amphidinium_carterae.1